MISRRIRKSISEAGGLVAILAILAAPIALKIPFGPLPLSPTDLLLATAIGLMAVARIRWSNLATEVKCLEPCAPFLAAMAAAALAAHEHAGAVKELMQVLLYAAGGVWLFSVCSRDARWRKRCHFGIGATILFALAGLAVQRSHYVTFTMAWFANPYSLACLTGILACLLVATESPSRRLIWGFDRALFGVTFCAVVACLIWPPVSATPELSGVGVAEPVPQRFLEGYAALSVLSSHPLTGLGLGSYQVHIGAYFQGMPKENSIAPGTQIGYCILIASTGVCGLAAFLYWLWQLLLRAWRCSSRPLAMLSTPAFLLFAGLVTPLLVSQILVPLALVHGLLWNGKDEECAEY